MKRIEKFAQEAEHHLWYKTYNVLHISILKSYFAGKEDASKNKLE